jgi:predicted HTH transcriptional regulator
MKEWGLLPPVFKNTTNSFRVILMGEELSSLNERQVKIWNYLLDNKRITAKECEKVMPDVPRKTINYDLKKLQEMKLLHSVGESINTYYEANF